MSLKLTNKSGNIAATAGMAGCYAMGNFTDNFFKQAAIIMAASLGLSTLQSLATVLFALPFILFSAWAGWLADRVQKKSIVVGAKVLELGALGLGALALWAGWWPGILAVVFIMAVQSTIFIPALNGAIPENFERAQVPRVNSIVRTISTTAILAGMALAGPLLDARPDGIFPALNGAEGAEYGRLAAGLFAVCVSVFGLLMALTVRRHERRAAQPRPFPWLGPVESFKHVLEYRKDRPLFTVMTGDAFFYGLAPIVIISIANLGKDLGYSDTVTSLLSASLMIGVAVGALIGGRSTPESWRRLMVPALSFMAACLALAAFTPLLPADARLPWLGATLLGAGVWGGIYLIPITSYMQVRPAAGEKGKVLAASNFYSFMSMLLFGAAFSAVSLLPTPLTFAVYAAAALIFAFAWVRPRLAGLEGASLKDCSPSIAGAILRAILALRYKVRENGLADISAAAPGGQKRPILFLPNHPALIDPLIVYSRIAGLSPRPLSDERRMSGPAQKALVRAMRIITIPDPMREGRQKIQAVRQGLDKMAQAMKNGDNVLLYPSGRIYRTQNEEIGANSAVARLLAQVPEARVVLVRSTGLWGSAFSRAGGRSPEFFNVLLRRIPALLFNLIFFLPRRKVTLDFSEVMSLPAGKMHLNRELERFYNATSQAAFSVPLYRWQGQTYLPRAEAAPEAGSAASADIPAKLPVIPALDTGKADELALKRLLKEKMHEIIEPNPNLTLGPALHKP